MSNQWYSAETAPVGVTLQVYDPTQIVKIRMAVLRYNGKWHPVNRGRALIMINLAPSYWRRIPPPS